ncbi:MAG: hypothetical protein LBR27_05270 [Bifidobacteriaceae bacterium]|jgi:hypothetical protein|nr:hypothetical protein [Bifidobacteriaceae bacterium]
MMTTQASTQSRRRPRPPLNPVRRALAAVATLAVVALGAAGCMRMNADFVINSDDSVDGSMVIAISDAASEELAASMGMTVDQMWDSAGMSPEDFTAEMAASLGDDIASTEPYSQDGYTGSRYIFLPMTLDDLGGTSAEDLSLVHQGDEYILSGNLDMTDEDLSMYESDPTTAGMMDSMEINFSFTFPGPVLSSNGVISGNTVTFPITYGEINTLEAVADASGSVAPITSTPSPTPSETETASPSPEPEETETASPSPEPEETETPEPTGEGDDEGDDEASGDEADDEEADDEEADDEDADDEGGFPWLWVGIGAGVLGAAIIVVVIVMLSKRGKGGKGGGMPQGGAPQGYQPPSAAAYAPTPTGYQTPMPGGYQTPTPNPYAPPAAAPYVTPTPPTQQFGAPGSYQPPAPTQQMPPVDPNQPWAPR